MIQIRSWFMKLFKEEIEKVAGQVGGMAFVEKIKSYAPVLLNIRGPKNSIQPSSL